MNSKRVLYILFFAAGIVCFFAFRIVFVHSKPLQVFHPQVVNVSLQPPKSAVEATIANVSGDVKKEGRNDTQFNPIKNATSLVEGEAISTGQNGSSVVVFPNIVTLTIDNNSELDYLNGLPNAIVVRQPNGSVAYSTSGTIKPFSVRSLGLLVEFTSSTLTITTDSNGQTVTVDVKSGLATLAYSDANNTTQVKQISKGQTADFDYTNQTLSLE